VTWSLPAKQESFQCKTDTPVLHSPKSSSRSNSTWRRTLNKLLKRTKSIERKKGLLVILLDIFIIKNFLSVISSPISDITYPYDFGIGEIKRTDSVASRSSSGKRVHWIDDDESILNACHHFIEYLKLYVQNIDKNDDNYLKNCQISLDELNSLVDCQQIQEAFDDIIQLAKTNDKDQLIQQQIYIENLISRTVLFTSSAS
jgi:hypothetical protein